MEEKLNTAVTEDNSQPEEVAPVSRQHYLTSFKFTVALGNYFCLAILLILGIGYLVVSNKLVSHGFTINNLKTDVNNLGKENRELELTAMSLESYDTINERVAKLGLVKTSEIEYLQVRGGEMAMR